MKYILTRGTFNYFDPETNSRVAAEAGDECELTTAQAEAFKDRFEPATVVEEQAKLAKAKATADAAAKAEIRANKDAKAEKAEAARTAKAAKNEKARLEAEVAAEDAAKAKADKADKGEADKGEEPKAKAGFFSKNKE